MTLRVKAGTPKGVDAAIHNAATKEEVRDYSDSPVPRNCRKTEEQVRESANDFLQQMEEGFSSEEANQGNPFDIPAVGSTKPRTTAEAFAELAFRIRILMVECFLPKGYEVVQTKPLKEMVDFVGLARELWASYEPLLGGRNTTTILQVEAPPELEEEENNG